MPRLIPLMAFLILLFASTNAESADEQSPVTRKTAPAVDSRDSAQVQQIIAYYFHGKQRCVTCRKLESYSHEALLTGFEKQLKDSSVVWRVVNFQEKGNEHFVDDYELFSQALIISRTVGNKEVDSRNLEKIWLLVGDKEKFIKYVQAEVQSLLKPELK